MNADPNHTLLDDILAIHDLPLTRVKIPEWNMTLHVRRLTAEERDEHDTMVYEDGKNETKASFRARLVAFALCDAEGNRLFADPRDGARKLGRKSALAIRRLFDAAAELSAMRDDDQKDLEKN